MKPRVKEIEMHPVGCTGIWYGYCTKLLDEKYFDNLFTEWYEQQKGRNTTQN
jgi:hypothetical protein